MSNLSLSNNPVLNRKKRYWLLERRLRKLSNYRRAHIEYEDGMAARMYINTDPRVTKASELRGRIKQEQREIQKWLYDHGYNLA
ncbi:MAG: hypothetical protein CL666_08710 [Balneola sp.]|nr:hypothetical protein [Balneola sp.]|tara:strand:+ start:12643 stop:12894 length:252 start_codon:yes stop_codon:yes gene_type:complete